MECRSSRSTLSQATVSTQARANFSSVAIARCRHNLTYVSHDMSPKLNPLGFPLRFIEECLPVPPAQEPP